MSGGSSNQSTSGGVDKLNSSSRSGPFLGINSSSPAIKRSSGDSSSDEGSNKKIRVDVHMSNMDGSNLLTLNSTAPASKDDLIVIRNFGSTNFSDMAVPPSSPLQSAELADEYVLFATDVMDYVDNSDSDYSVNLTTTTTTTTLQSSLMSTSAAIKTASTPTTIHNAVIQATLLPSSKPVDTTSVASSSKSFATRKNISTVSIDTNIVNTVTTSDLQSAIVTQSAVNTIHNSTDDTDVMLHAPDATTVINDPKIISPMATSTKSDFNSGPLKPPPGNVTRINAITSGNVIRKNTITYSRISGAATQTTTSAASASVVSTTASNALLNRVNIHSALKNHQHQPLIMTTKKLMSEVTQTTAKVSIGNTTISVPLLKPLNTTQLIQSSGEVQKQHQHPNAGATTQQQTTATTQLNLSKILNVKRSGGSGGQKVTHQATIVSLSQLQIKPVSANAKIVQAKVVNKKMAVQLPSTSVSSSNHMQSTAAVVTITAASKSKHNLVHNFTHHPKLSSQLTVVQQESPLPQRTLPHSVLQEKVITSVSASDGRAVNAISTSSDNIEHSAAEVVSDIEQKKWLGGSVLHQRPETKISTITITEEESAPVQIRGINTSADENAKNKFLLSASTIGTAVAGSPMPPPPPLLTPISKYVDQQQQLKMSLNIIKQHSTGTVPQLITTTATTTKTTSSATEDTVAPTVLDSNFLQTASTGFPGVAVNLGNNTVVGKLNSSPLIGIPKNISLLLARSNVSQQQQQHSQQQLTKAATTLASASQHTATTGVASATSHIITSKPTHTPNDHPMTKKINLTMSSALNITPLNVTPTAHGHVHSYVAPSQSLESSSVSSSHKQSVLSMSASSVQPLLELAGGGSSFLEQASVTTTTTCAPRKTLLKVASNTIVTALGGHNHHHQLIKRSKSTDEGGSDRSIGGCESQFSQAPHTLNYSKRHSMEIISTRRSGGGTAASATEDSSLTSDDADANCAGASGSMNKLANSVDKKSTLLEGRCGGASSLITTQEITHNVLLKQLLQNSSTSSNLSAPLNICTTATSTCASIATSTVSTMCNQALSARKVINMRAPSLGLVSSLEAQLARPVIPPAQVNAPSGGTPTASQMQSSATDSQHETKLHPPLPRTVSECQNKKHNEHSAMAMDSVAAQSETKSKVSAHVISKETSFISNPNLIQNSSQTSDQHQLQLSTTVASTTINNAGAKLNDNLEFNTDTTTTELNLTAKQIDPLLHIKTVDLGCSKSPIDSSHFSKEKNISCIGSISNSSQKNTSTVNRIVRNDKAIRIESYNGNSKVNNAVGLHLEKNVHSIGIKLNLPPNTQCISTSKISCPTDNTNVNEDIFSHQSILYNTNKSPQKTENLKITSADTRPDMMLMNTASDVLSKRNIPSTTNIFNDNMSTDNAGAILKSQSTADKFQCTASKDADMRKKRKREYQKQRRQLLSHSKDLVLAPAVSSVSASNSSTAKKRPRKLSKIEEDYDNFIDNLMAHIRQMQQLQVLEPLLNRNFGICSMYGRRNLARMISTKENEDQVFEKFLLGEYGNARHLHMISLYDSKRFIGLSFEEKQLSTIQNDFYDQEFSSLMYKNENDKLVRFIGIIRERNLEALETINNENCNVSQWTQSMINCSSQWNLQHIAFPGLILTNNTRNPLLDRMSPIIPLVETNGFKIKGMTMPVKLSLSDKNINLTDEGNKPQNNFLDQKTGYKEEKDPHNQTVILSLPLTVTDNILGVLRDLANLIQTTPPTTYKVITTTIRTSAKQCRQHKTDRRVFKRYRGYPNLQKIITGRRKMCRNCGQAIEACCIRASKGTFPNAKLILESTQKSVTYIYFCSKTCYVQFKFRVVNQSTVFTDKAENKLISALGKNSFKENVTFNTDPGYKIKLTTSMKTNEEDDKNEDEKEERRSPKSGYKCFKANCFYPVSQFKRISDKEVTSILYKMNITMSAKHIIAEAGGAGIRNEDTRQCVFCNQEGDGLSDGPSRLLNFEVDKWVHLNCALWSNGVYETISGGLMNFPAALHMGLNQACSVCLHMGATIKCFKNRCGTVFHLPCAIKEQCVFYKNKTLQCQQHAPRTEKENELISLAVQRRVFVERDENRQVATVMHHSELSNLLRVGSLTFLNVGQLLPHQLEAFHNANHIYPIGYKIVRFYWSMKRPYKRCRYICSIAEAGGHPEFRILVQEHLESDIELRDSSAKAVWQRILETIAANRKQHDLVQLFPQFISGEDLFGLTEPSIVRIIESLPGIETLTDYRFKYGRNPLLELPLAINPSGAARAEPKPRQLLAWRKPHTQRTGTTSNQRMSNPTSSVVAGEVACPYSKQFVHSKSSQYKKMKQEWRNNVYLARSKIQGLGLYASRDMEKHTMIIEYIGEVIRTEVSELREKQYEAKNRGIYMFRLDEDRVVDATLSGGLARYINHSCNPNCVTEIVEVDRDFRIIIFAKRRINRGEELSYDYKFDIEDDEQKIPCMCGAPNCRKWMN